MSKRRPKRPRPKRPRPSPRLTAAELPELPQSLHRVAALLRQCILCLSPEVVAIGRYAALTPELNAYLGAPPDKTRVLLHGICGACLDQKHDDLAAKVEVKIFASVDRARRMAKRGAGDDDEKDRISIPLFPARAGGRGV